MAAWDEDDHLLDEIVHDNDGNADAFEDGWDEDLGLSSDDDDEPISPADVSSDERDVPVLPSKEADVEQADATAGRAVGTESEALPHVSADLAAPVASSCGEEAEEDNAWDFDDFDDSSVDAPSAPINGSSQPPASSADAEALSNVNHAQAANLGANLSADKNEQIQEQMNIQSVVSEESTKNQTSQNGDQWDFEDDLFSEQSDEVKAEVNPVGNAIRPPPPPPPPPPPLPMQPNPFLSDMPAVPKSNPFLAEPQISSQQHSKNILTLDQTSQEAQKNAPINHTLEDINHANDNDGWSDDEAFFDDDAMENLPVIPSKLSKSPTPTPPPPPQTHQQPLTDPTQIKILNLLQSYLANISSPRFLPRLHAKMHADSNVHEQGANLRQYYVTRPGLRQYTLGVEMDRMDYTLVTHDGMRMENKEEIRRYFGQNGQDEPSVDEVLIRSANQSLLADALVLLTGSEDVLSNDEFFNNEDMSLILSGPLLCMTSVAETCRFVVDLMNGVVEVTCFLAIGVPFDGEKDNGRTVKDGRLVLARARILVRFRPGSIEMDEECTVQYVVESVEPSIANPDAPLLRDVAISLARDQHDPFFQREEVQEDVTDVRDLFLLNHHLLSDSHLLAVSDHLVRLKGAAEASSTGFRSALRQLDGVTGVSGKINMIKNATGAGASGRGIGGFLSLPSAQEIEAAEREASGSVSFHADSGGHFPRPNDAAAGHFPRPNEILNQNVGQALPYGYSRPSPSPPPPPQPQMTPQPLIGGMLLSGLSRLAAAATQPSDHRTHSSYHNPQPENQSPPLHNTEDHAKTSHHIPQWNGSTGGTGLTSSVADTAHNGLPSFASPTFRSDEKNNDSMRDTSPIDEKEIDPAIEMDGGWSDDGLEFDDEYQQEEPAEANIPTHQATESSYVKSDTQIVNDYIVPPQRDTARDDLEEKDLKFSDAPKEVITSYHPEATKQHRLPTATFDEEFVIVLKEKIEAEEAEMKENGRLRRWRPLSEDPIRRQILMEAMVRQLEQA